MITLQPSQEVCNRGPAGRSSRGAASLAVKFRIKSDQTERTLRAVGRSAWALLRLHNAGAAGVTPTEEPGPRWSEYVRQLRRDGVNIETRLETHGGRFAGSHGRYVLLDGIAILEIAEGGKAVRHVG